MPAPKGNSYAAGNGGGGRPSSYKPEYAEMARKITLLGATDVELAEVFEVSESTINAWKLAHKEFFAALKAGKMIADANVADRLYQRAMGFEHPEVDIRVVNQEIVQTPITKIYAPDPAAAIFWLKNRQRGKWRDKIDTEHSGSIGSSAISDDELAARIAKLSGK